MEERYRLNLSCQWGDEKGKEKTTKLSAHYSRRSKKKKGPTSHEENLQAERKEKAHV